MEASNSGATTPATVDMNMNMNVIASSPSAGVTEEGEDMAIEEKLEKGKRKKSVMVGTKKRERENGSEVSDEENLKNSSMKTNDRRKRKRMKVIRPAVEQVVVMDIETSVAEVEKILNYRFRNKNLLEEALIHPTSSLSPPNYERLEFLGDVTLELALANVVFITYPDLEFGLFSQLLSANVSTGKLARDAIRNGLYRYLCRDTSRLAAKVGCLETKVRNFADMVPEECGNEAVYGEALKAPKVLADIVESIAAAIYIDCEFDLKLFWKYFGDLLEPLVIPEMLQHFMVTRLYRACEKEGKQVEIKHRKEGSQNIASVFVNGQLLSSGYSGQKINATCDAAKKAMELWEWPFPVDVKVARAIKSDLVPEIDEAKDKLYALFHKNQWQKPTFKVEEEMGPQGKRYTICSVQIETVKGSYVTSGGAKPSVQDAENSAASMLLYALPKRKKKKYRYAEAKKRKKETGSEVSAEEVEGDMAVEEKLEKKSNRLVGTKRSKMENGSEVSADKVKVDMEINEELEKKRNKLVQTKKLEKQNGSDVSAEKENSSMETKMKSTVKTKELDEIMDSEKHALTYAWKHCIQEKTSLVAEVVAELEEILGYRFRNKTLLEAALTLSSYSSSTASLSPNYQQLELLGEAALCLAVANFAFITYPNHGPGQLSQLVTANVNTEKLARVAIRHGFYRYLRHSNPLLDAKIRDFALVVQEEGNIVVYGGTVKAPKVLAEIVKSIAAAIYIDCEFDFKLLWKYFCGLLEPWGTLETLHHQP